MEEEFYKDDFEQFLQKHANNHRMYPGDGIWPAIHKKLHGHKKWPALTIAAIIMLATTIAVTVYFTPGSKIFEVTAQQASLGNNKIINQHGSLSSQPSYGLLKRTSTNTNSTNTNSTNTNSTNTNSTNTNNLVVPTDPPTTFNLVSNNSDIAASIPVDDLAIGTEFASKPTIIKKDPGTISGVIAQQQNVNNITNSTSNINEFNNAEEVITADNALITLATKEISTTKALKNSQNHTSPNDADNSKMVDKFLDEHTKKANDIDLVSSRRKEKLSYTIYVTPSASYRRLKEDDILQRNNFQNNGPVALNFVADVNKVVRHRPGVGFETGVGFTYQLSSTLGIRTGLQFNFRQYNIDAYRSPYELTSIALVSNTGVDTINLLTAYRNNNGISSAEIVNKFLQVSIPIGIDWQVIGNQKIGLNLAASIQPTYVIKSDPFVLSSNFKNYTRNSNMLRQWNINSSVEAYLTIKTGDYRWQIGPQVRYQQLPTLKSAYPIHENLVDYGFKVGITRFIK